MHPVRKQRLQWILLILVATSIGIGLVVYTLRQNANYFYTPSQIASGVAPLGVALRAGGMVTKGSLHRIADSLEVSFDVSDGAARLRVHFTGILPDLFAEGQAAVVTGKLDDQSIMRATQVLAKHDENYMPPEVADAVLEAYKRPDERARVDEEPYYEP